MQPLSFSLTISLSFHAPHANTSLSLSPALCAALSFSLLLSLHFIPSHHRFPPAISPLCISVPWHLFAFKLSFPFSIFTLSLFISHLLLSFSPSPLVFSLSLLPFISACLCVLPFLLQKLLFLTLWAFFLSTYPSLWASLWLPPSRFGAVSIE